MKRSQAPQDSPLAAPLEEGVIHKQRSSAGTQQERQERLDATHGLSSGAIGVLTHHLSELHCTSRISPVRTLLRV